MRAYRVGLTGGIASGKSTVAAWLAEAGFVVVDADRLVADLYRPGQPGAAAVRDLFGAAALTGDGAVDHAAVAARVFADPDARHALEHAIHPLVRRRFEDLAAAAEAPEAAGARGAASPTPPPVVVLEATLLVEAGYAPGFDLVVTIEGDPEERVRRAVARGLPEAAARARLAAQGDGVARRAGANRVVDNHGTLADLRHEIDALIADIRAAATTNAAAAAAAAAADRR